MDAFRAALPEYTRERVPLQWAYAQHGLAQTLELLAERRQDPAQMTEALDCMRGAIEVYRNGGVSYWLPIAKASLARMQTKLAVMKGDQPRSNPPPRTRQGWTAAGTPR